jgi:DNA invertase Pin-like site-specific DNA recombinase
LEDVKRGEQINMTRFIGYFRVSTVKQGESGLGLAAQRASVQAFVKGGELIAEYTEVESGKHDDRPELTSAIAHAKREGATLLVAKLDRLSRSAGFIFLLRDTGVKFVACDCPEANSLTIGILASLAQHERELISQRTKSALAQKKRQGYKLGVSGKANLIAGDASNKASAARKRYATNDPNNRAATELVVLYREKGMTLQQIADRLNSNGHATRYNKQFKPGTVQRLIKRAQTR